MGRWTALAAVMCALGCDSGTTCTPESDQAFCERNEKDCDAYTGFDNCGASRTVACGTCELPSTCGGSGVVNVCGSPGADGGMTDAGSDAGMLPPPTTILLRGTITDNPDTVNGTRSSDLFDPLMGATIECVLTVPPLVRTTSMALGTFDASYRGTGSTVTCTGSDDAALARIEAALDSPDTRVAINLERDLTFGEQQDVSVEIISAESAEYFSIIGFCHDATFTPDAEGYLVLEPFECDTLSVSWRRFTGPPELMTDFADGAGRVESHAM